MRALSACAVVTFGLLSPAAAQYAIRGGPVYGGPFIGGGPSLYVGAYAPPYYPYPLPGAGFGPSYLGAAPYAASAPIMVVTPVPPPRYYASNGMLYPGAAAPPTAPSVAPRPELPSTVPKSPAEGSRSGPAAPTAPNKPDQGVPIIRTHFTVLVPRDAKVWVNDVETKQTGASRRFHTPGTLDPGKSYEYTFRVQWAEAGQPVTRDRVVRFKGGEDKTIDFTQASAR